MTRRSRVLALLPAALALVSLAACDHDVRGGEAAGAPSEPLCDFSAADFYESIGVDCTGLMVWPGSKAVTLATSPLSYYDASSAADTTSTGGPVCAVLFDGSPAASPARLSLAPLERSANGGVGMVLRDRAATWVPEFGCLKVDQVDLAARRGAGRYEAVVVDTATTGARRRRRVSGAIDWCAYGAHPDCPVQLDPALTKKITYGAPLVVTSRLEGQDVLKDCRVVIDTSTGGMRVDLELATRGGVPVSQLNPVCHYSASPGLPQANSFVFWAGDVTAPGSYGPTLVDSGGGFTLPRLNWSIPIVWDTDGLNTYCAQTDVSQYIALAEEAQCSWEIQVSPGRFTLKCDQAVAARASSMAPASQRGPLEITADCDVHLR